MNDRAPAAPAAHAGHDPSLVAAYAAGDAAGRELAEARALVSGCAGCAELHRDLRAIAAALPAVPAPARPASRDFRITPEQAAALRPSRARGALARLLAPLASARFAFAGPAGAGVAALGLAGVLLSGGLGQPVGHGDRAAAPVTSTAGSGSGFAAPAPTAVLAPLDQAAGVGGANPTASTEAGGTTTKASGAPVGANAQGGQATPAIAACAAPAGATGVDGSDDTHSPVTGPAALLLGAGVALLALRLGARRAVASR